MTMQRNGGATNTEWRADALCAQTDPEAFFPDKGGSPAAAKAVCHRCPVRSACLDWALEHDMRFGVWGGLTERQRRRLQRRGGAHLTEQGQESVRAGETPC